MGIGAATKQIAPRALMRRSRKARNRRYTVSLLRLRNAARADAAATECTGFFCDERKVWFDGPCVLR